MRILFFTLATLALFWGCSTKNLRVSGMICPNGFDATQVQSDFQSCRAYNDEDATKASFPKSLSKECKECLIERGYEVEQ